MIDKAWCSIEEVPYCFPRSSIKFQVHNGQKIDDLDQIWARLLGRSQLSNPSDLPCYIKVLFEIKIFNSSFISARSESYSELCFLWYDYISAKMEKDYFELNFHMVQIYLILSWNFMVFVGLELS